MKNALVSLTSTSTLVMSSLEVAELTGKEHKNVTRDIRVMLDDLEITQLSFERSYKDSTGRTLPMFNLPNDLSITFVSGYSAPMRFAIVKRWMELEAQEPATARVPTNFREALLLAAAVRVLAKGKRHLLGYRTSLRKYADFMITQSPLNPRFIS